MAPEVQMDTSNTEADRPALAVVLCRCKEDVANAETALQDILKDLRRQLQLPSLEYKTVQNQGVYLIEVPTERTDVPKVRCRAGKSMSCASIISMAEQHGKHAAVAQAAWRPCC